MLLLILGGAYIIFHSENQAYRENFTRKTVSRWGHCSVFQFDAYKNWQLLLAQFLAVDKFAYFLN